MPQHQITVAIPTIEAGAPLAECIGSLAAQTFTDFEAIVIDNSGAGRATLLEEVRRSARVVENPSNVGFGAAVNQAIRASTAPFILTINDDTVLDPNCLAAMLRAIESHYEIGMCAPQIRLHGQDRLDSAGMLLCRDASSKQRGHLEPPDRYSRPGQTLFPSGCAALYRREMLDEIGLFDERFFLYCEDTDLGLRARWKLWECAYAPDAVVYHRYSQSAGRASPLKAYYVERNRLFVAFKNFPARELVMAPFVSLARYFWHAVYLIAGRGKAAEFAGAGESALKLPWYVVRAYAALVPALPSLLRDRRRIQRYGRLQPRQFHRVFASYGISARRVAEL